MSVIINSDPSIPVINSDPLIQTLFKFFLCQRSIQTPWYNYKPCFSSATNTKLVSFSISPSSRSFRENRKHPLSENTVHVYVANTQWRAHWPWHSCWQPCTGRCSPGRRRTAGCRYSWRGGAASWGSCSRPPPPPTAAANTPWTAGTPPSPPSALYDLKHHGNQSTNEQIIINLKKITHPINLPTHQLANKPTKYLTSQQLINQSVNLLICLTTNNSLQQQQEHCMVISKPQHH